MYSRKNNKRKGPAQPKAMSKRRKLNDGTSVPLARSNRVRMSAPVMRSQNGHIVISHKEYLGEVTSSAVLNAFAVGSYTINPGLSVSFPWLSQIAPAYESYQFEKLDFIYEPSISASTSGVVALAVEYDVSDSDPSNKGDLMSNVRAVRSAVWQRAVYSSNLIDAGVMTKRRYVRPGAVPSGDDPRSFDMGKLLVGTSGIAANTNIGEIYAQYTVSFFTPQKDNSGLASARSAKVVGAAGVDKTHLFGTSAATITGNLPISAITNTLTFSAPGEYLVATYGTGTGTNGATGTPTATGCTVSTITPAVNDSGTNTSFLFTYRVTVPTSGATVAIDNSGATTISAFVARVATYAYANA